MRALFFTATGLFWAAVMAFAIAGTSTTPAAPKPATPAVAADKHYTLVDVAKHASEDDCWMAIGGVIYDVTAYLPEHPTRPSVILPWCGKEASNAYQTKTKGRPHSPEADLLLPTYRIGVLAKP